MHRIYAIRAFVVLLLALTVLAGTRIGLVPQDLNVVHPLEAISGGLLDDTTLQRALATIGTAHQTLLITPGTWTMTDNLTIPAHVNLWLAAGAQFSINAGRTLTINGTLSAPLMPIFSGAGRVIFGGRSLGLHPHWFGTSCDGVADDTQALQKTIDTASASASQRVWLPANANCRITAELLLRTGVEIFGHGRLSSRITVVGAGVRGLVYNPAVLTQAAITLSHFAVIGHDATVGNLIDVRQAGDFYISSLQASTTGGSGIYWDTVHQSSVRNSRIEQAAQHGIHFKSSNTFHIDNVNVQSGPAVVGQSGIYLDACDRGRVQSSALEGYSISGAAIRLNGVSDTDIVDNFLEFYAEAIRGERAASGGVRVAGNHLQATGQVRLEFSIGSLPHERMVFERNTCVLAAQDYCLKGVENIFRSCTKTIPRPTGRI
jgi:hypothetical protein